MTKQLVDSFEGAHHQLETTPWDDVSNAPCGTCSGACGVALLLRHRRFIIAHVGDCRAVLGTLGNDGTLHHVELSKDHKLEDEEAQRVLQTGAWIRPKMELPYFAPARVYASQENPRGGPGLTMSRSLGDLDADPVGVIPTPEVSFRPVQMGRDKFVVLASDGLFEFISNETVVEVVGGCLNRGEPAIDAARFLIAMAAFAWQKEEGDYRDDITAVVVYIDDVVKAIEM